MTGSVVLERVAQYTATWNTLDRDEMTALLEASWSDDGVIVDAEHPAGVVGRDDLGALVRRTHADLPGLVVRQVGEAEVLAGRVRTFWVATTADPATRFAGTDFIEFAPDGRIARVTTFDDQPAPAGQGS